MNEIYQQFEHDLIVCAHPRELEQVKIKYLGKKGIIQAHMQELKSLSSEQKRVFGAQINELKEKIETTIASFASRLEKEELEREIAKEGIDITIPGRKRRSGSKHPISQTIEEIVAIFEELGFSTQIGPEVDSDYYNFDVLNFPADHPAKDMQDTFYIEPGVLLRTHTTTVQGRVMERSSAPIRIVCPGRVFRNESVSARSHVFFHQVDGVYVDQGVSMQDLIWTLSEFIRRLFHKNVQVRFRPSYFPFVEPGTEVDVECLLCKGSKCPLCKHTGWLEILGAGMVHPNVLANVGIDPEKYTGFAWGLGVERIVMLRHAIKDIRLFAENDLRFLQQFASV
ncbi:MAG: phenylalanine--tRNA ligase subunit alpha [Chlamydia sp.]